MTTQIQFRRDTAAVWSSVNPILADGEMGLEKDTKKFKVGDGITAWNSLAYSSGPQGPQGPAGSDGANGLDGDSSIYAFFPGTTSNTTGTARRYMRYSKTIKAVSIWCTTAAPSTTTVDILKNGSIVASATISTGQTYGTSGTISIAVASGDYLTTNLTSSGAQDVTVRIDT